MSYKEYTCPRCSRVHAAILLVDAEAAAGELGDMASYFRCFECRAPSTTFVPSQPADAPVGCTLTPVVVPGAWPDLARGV